MRRAGARGPKDSTWDEPVQRRDGTLAQPNVGRSAWPSRGASKGLDLAPPRLCTRCFLARRKTEALTHPQERRSRRFHHRDRRRRTQTLGLLRARKTPPTVQPGQSVLRSAVTELCGAFEPTCSNGVVRSNALTTNVEHGEVVHGLGEPLLGRGLEKLNRTSMILGVIGFDE